ncbi:MAG TPA: DUF1059 domain-containing protein [Miltoncostaea sp.]|nr:DUF1059 domain-containing protein [Miltoncostaea sp.]
MAYEYSCPSCGETLRADTAADLIKRAAAHSHQHHGGPESVTPEIEAAIQADMTTVSSPH